MASAFLNSWICLCWIKNKHVIKDYIYVVLGILFSMLLECLSESGKERNLLKSGFAYYDIWTSDFSLIIYYGISLSPYFI